MQVIILAGGKGTRMGNITEKIPKPMIRLGNKPMILKIMEHYSLYGLNDFLILTGYKQDIIKDYFSKLPLNNCDIEIDYSKNKIEFFNNTFCQWNIKIINTGLNSNTGLRLLKAEKYINDDYFHLTYGDGLSDININELTKFHIKQKKILTITGVKPPTKFGELVIKDNVVKSFEEKPKLSKGIINGGYMVSDKRLLNEIEGDVMLERDPMVNLCKRNEMSCYIHNGFWKCFDTAKDVKSYKEI